MFSNFMKYNRCYYMTKDSFASLGTLFCPQIVPNHDLCLPGSDLLVELDAAVRAVIRDTSVGKCGNGHKHLSVWEVPRSNVRRSK
jgi:hypothetical protein